MTLLVPAGAKRPSSDSYAGRVLAYLETLPAERFARPLSADEISEAIGLKRHHVGQAVSGLAATYGVRRLGRGHYRYEFEPVPDAAPAPDVYADPIVVGPHEVTAPPAPADRPIFELLHDLEGGAKLIRCEDGALYVARLLEI